jgi:hypothetical protein
MCFTAFITDQLCDFLVNYWHTTKTFCYVHPVMIMSSFYINLLMFTLFREEQKH